MSDNIFQQNLMISISQPAKTYFLGDSNVGMETTAQEDFCKLYSLTSLINKSIYYKNRMISLYIYLILTDSLKYFQNSDMFI